MRMVQQNFVAALVSLGLWGGVGIDVKASAQTVDFEDVTLASKSSWTGPVAKEDGSEMPGGFGSTIRTGYVESGGVQFVNRFQFSETFTSWSGFAISNKIDVTTSGFLNSTSAFTGTGFGPGSDNYAVAFGYAESLDDANADALEQLPHFNIPRHAHVRNAQITNTTYAALSMQMGDGPGGFAKKFGGETSDDPDFLRLSIHGTDRDGVPLAESVEFYLADYRFEDNSQDYILDQWALVDFSPLAAADRLYFNLNSSDVGEFGMNTPALFAIDNITLFPDVPGDVDLDGSLSVDDVNSICSAVAADVNEHFFDVDGDGSVSQVDVAALLDSAGRLPGDTDFDGKVRFSDFLTIAASFGASATWSQGDFNCDGETQFNDFLVLSQNFAETPSVAAVAEPTAGILAMCGLAILCIRPRRGP